MYSVPFSPISGAHFADLETFSALDSWKGAALLIETLASFVMSQVRGIADWVQGLFADWTSQPEVTHAPKDSLIDDFFEADGGSEEDVKSQKREDIKAAIRVIQSDAQVGNRATSTYMDDLAKSFVSATFIDRLTFMSAKASETFVEKVLVPQVDEAKSQEKEFVFIPIVFQSLVEPHIVLFTVNLKENVIEYYDPKGSGIGTQKVLALKNVNVLQFSEDLKRNLGVNKIQTSDAEHQHWRDTKNCGRLVMNFMKQRLEQASFKDAIHSVRSLSEIKRELVGDLEFSIEMLA